MQTSGLIGCFWQSDYVIQWPSAVSYVKLAVNLIREFLHIMSYFSGCFQDFLFVFGFP